jgi:hypothetical protein
MLVLASSPDVCGTMSMDRSAARKLTDAMPTMNKSIPINKKRMTDLTMGGINGDDVIPIPVPKPSTLHF